MHCTLVKVLTYHIEMYVLFSSSIDILCDVVIFLDVENAAI